MLWGSIRGMQLYGADFVVSGSYFDFFCLCRQLCLWSKLVPDRKPVSTRRKVRDLETALGIAHGEVFCLQHDDGRAHLRMNITENIGDARLAEPNFSRRSTFIQSQVDCLPLMNGEHIVKKQILVGEFDLRTLS